jgi:ATP/maltotriose-dependent transcriptional regulator MalT
MHIRADNEDTARDLLKKCRYEDNIDKRIEMLNRINSMLPQSKRVRSPSLLMHDYINRALDRIEELYDIKEQIWEGE